MLRERLPWGVCLSCALFGLAIANAASAVEPVRIHGAVYRGSQLDPALTDLWEHELSSTAGLELIDRTNLQRLAAELGLGSVHADATNRLRMGHWLAVDAFAWLRMTDDGVVLEVIEAATGREFGYEQRTISTAELPTAFKLLAQAVVDAAAGIREHLDLRRTTLALGSPLFSPQASQPARAQFSAAVTALEQELQKAGSVRLHRRFTRDLISERELGQAGFTTGQRSELPLLGAEFVLVPRQIGASDQLELVLVETATARHVAAQSWPLKTAATSDGRAQIVAWLEAKVKPKEPRPGEPDSKSRSKSLAHDQIAAETLETLSHAILAHNEGRYIEALPLLADVYHRDNRLGEVVAWLESCYRHAGFTEIADNCVASWKNNDFLFNAHQTKQLAPAPGVALLGVTITGEVSPSFAGALEILLIEALHKQTTQTVLLTRDLSTLRDEYDVLTGIANARGTTWQTAPPMLLREAVTAHLLARQGQVYLRLCRVLDLKPDAIGSIEVALPADVGMWQATIGQTVAEMYDTAKPFPVWTAPALVVKESATELLARLKEKYDDVDCLKLLSLNPKQVWFVSRFPKQRMDSTPFGPSLEAGLEAWAIHHMQPDDPLRPWFEFAYTKYFMPHAGPQHNLAHWPDYRAELKRLADRYSEHPVGLICRYNLLLSRLAPENYARSQGELAEIIAGLNAAGWPHFDPTARESMEKLDAALRFMFDRPGGKPMLFAHASFWIRGSLFDGELTLHAGALSGSPRLDTEAVQPDSREKMFLEMRGCLLIRDFDLVPCGFYTKTIQKYGAGSEPARYAVLRFGQSTVNRGIPLEKKADFQILFAEYCPAIVELFERDPVPLEHQEAGSVFAPLERIRDAWLGDANFEQGYRQARKAALRAFIEGRLSHLSSSEVEWFMGYLAQDHDQECDALLRQWAASSWQGDPLVDDRWQAYIQWLRWRGSKQDIATVYRQYLKPLHRRFDRAPKTRQLAEMYRDFAVSFYRVEEFATCRPLLEQVASWRDEHEQPIDEAACATCRFLLATLELRDHRPNQAIRLAEQTLGEIGERTILLDKTVYSNDLQHWTGGDSLKNMVSNFIIQVRADPETPFRNLYGKP